MPDQLKEVVRFRTKVTDGYAAHASPRSMNAFLADWKAAERLLARQIGLLEDLRDHRERQIALGEWPAKEQTDA
jgi:hypothetical protein